MKRVKYRTLESCRIQRGPKLSVVSISFNIYGLDTILQKNRRRAARRKLRRAAVRREEQEKIEKAELEMQKVCLSSIPCTASQNVQILALIYQYDVKDIHIHNLQLKPKDLAKLQERERDKGFPLTRADVDELVPNTVWMYEHGLHLGLLSEEDQELPTIPLVVKVTYVVLIVFSR